MEDTVEAFYGAGPVEEAMQRTAVDQVLREFQNNPDTWHRVMHILRHASVLDVKFSALQVLEDFIKSRWSALPVAQRCRMKNDVSKLIVQLSRNHISFCVEKQHIKKLNIMLVQILKHEGPVSWRSIFPDLVAAAKESGSVCEHVMAILKLLSEEVPDVSRAEMTQQEIEDLKLSLCNEFQLIHELCLCTLAYSRRARLICATLSTLHAFLSWLPLGSIFDSPLLEMLLDLFPVAQYRNLTLQCLTKVAALNSGGFHDVRYVKMHNRFMVELQAILTPASDIPRFYDFASGEERAFIKNLALFLTTFYKFHIRVLESTQKNIAALLVGLEYLRYISYVSGTEAVKVCLDYWNYLLERFAVQCFLDSPAVEAANLMCLELLSNEASHPKERLFVDRVNGILVRILKHEGAVRWRSFIPDLVAAAKKSERVCENFMAISKLLSEKVLDFSRGEMTQQEIEDLKQSLNSEFQLVHESKKQLLAVPSKLEGSEQQPSEQSGSEEESAVELQKISHEPDPAQHSEQEAVQQQNAADSFALATAMNEIQQLKVQLEEVSESEAAKTKDLESANAELQNLRRSLAETVSLVENMKDQLQECKESEAQSPAQAREITVGQIKSESSSREAELEAELRRMKADVEELKANPMDKETELPGICEENEGLNLKPEKNLACQKEYELQKEVKKLYEYIADVRANLMDKETELQKISEENEMLKSNIRKRGMDRGKVTKEVVAEVEAAKNAERVALMKLGIVMEEADRSNKRAARLTEQLEAAQSANSEMEAELKKLKV